MGGLIQDVADAQCRPIDLQQEHRLSRRGTTQRQLLQAASISAQGYYT